MKVHLDTDYLCLPKDFLGLAPMSVLCDRISSVVNPGVESLDCPLSAASPAAPSGVWTEGTSRQIRFLFREFISELLQVCRVPRSLAALVGAAVGMGFGPLGCGRIDQVRRGAWGKGERVWAV